MTEVNLEDKKKQLEIEKLEHEIKLQKKPLFFLSTYAKIITVAFQLLTGVIAFVFAYKNDWFNVQHDKLEIKKERLNIEIDQFKITRENIKDSINLYRHINDSVSEIVKKELIHNIELSSENADLQEQISNSKLNFDATPLFQKKFWPGKFNSHYKIAGYLKDTNNNKIINANVVAQSFMTEKNQIKKIKSDINGYFRIDYDGNFLSSRCKIKITKKGYKDLKVIGDLVDSQRNDQRTIFILHKNEDSTNDWDNWIRPN